MECELLSRNSSSNHSLHYDYEPITPLRCLTLKQTHPPNWEILCSMEDHNDIRRTLPNIWDGNQTNIVNIIRNKWNIVDYTELEIHTVCGILETNAFDVSHNGSKARALYSSSFLFSHNCVPNTTHTNDHNYHFKIRTSVPVPRNQTLTLTYTYIIEVIIVQ
ncbi:uncharacterized protein LOC103516993 [Diaphorina citri]|uniref:Uncharacterized protein LOC103516993 n=1 Tax=Diaphorina citri TaxID=121845 RepID=A0A1S3DFY8_DIACI|nr:uncharacterized protein LOC103516993 [Diaphorina citri]KAI5753730.1 hypothetical protein M8J77_002843 [Diaphorina citri]